MMKRTFCFFAPLLALVVAVACNAVCLADDKEDENYDAIAESQADDDKYEWVDLFDGETLNNWIDTRDAGDDVVKVKDGVLLLGMGPTTTSIRFDEENSKIELPRKDYEIEYVARRSSGTDFFAALTFPIGEKCVTFVNGGWGGFVVGISSIDRMDASENSTSSFFNFKTNRWYRFRVQVTARSVRVWIDNEKAIDYVVENHELGTRFEVSRCEPLGFASWVSGGDIKVVRMRSLSAEEIEEIDVRAEQASKFFLKP